MTDIEIRRAKERAKKAAYRAANPHKAATQNRRAYEQARLNVAAFLCLRAKIRAKRRGIPFALTPADIDVPNVCPALGIPLAFGISDNGRDNSPSLDRIIPDLGYMPGNVRVISYRANRIKNDSTVDELRALIRYLSP